MATYKLIQDIEAEDHILGPLSLRQFIFALISVFCFYICFILITRHIQFLLALFLPPALFAGFFAIPFGRDQPTEVWALAKLRFWFKPRKRIWDQSGVKELVTITVPKKIERVLTDGLSQGEVQSRLKALANTIDSRGWAIKNVNVSAFSQPDALSGVVSDRLIDVSAVPQEVPNYEVLAADDVLDEVNNPIARQFDQMIAQSSQVHRQQIVDQLNSPVITQPVPQPSASSGQQASEPADYWFMNGTANPLQTKSVSPVPAQDATPDEAAFVADHLKAQNDTNHATNSHLRTLQPLGDQTAATVSVSQSQQLQPVDSVDPVAPMTAPTDPAILNLANNNDLNVATLAREAYKVKNNDEPQDEVVISLR